MAKVSKVSTVAQLDQLRNILNNPEMSKWAEKADAGGHGAYAATKHIRLNLSACMKECKAFREQLLVLRANL